MTKKCFNCNKEVLTNRTEGQIICNACIKFDAVLYCTECNEYHPAGRTKKPAGVCHKQVNHLGIALAKPTI